MEPGVAGFLGVDDTPELSAVLHFARVADLTAHFGVEGGGVENDSGLVFAIQEFEDFRWGLKLLVADELRGSGGFDLGEFDDLFFLSGTSLSSLLFHQLVKFIDINIYVMLTHHELSKV